MKKQTIQARTANDVVNLALDTISKGKQALIFVNSKPSAEKTAEDISKQIKDISLSDLSNKSLKALSKPTKQCERLSRCIKRGVAFHHAGLTSVQKDLIENAFKDQKIKIIACTPTLAAGVDLPAYRAIIKDLRRYSSFGQAWIPVLEYQQMAGRAGRPRFDTEGQVILVAANDNAKEEITERYILGEVEEIYSKLAVEPVLRTYLLSLIATGIVNTKDEALSFFEKTFWAHQYQDLSKLESIITRMLKLLDDYEFISMESKDFVDADELESGKIKPTHLGKRVAQLYIDPLTANYLITCIRKASSMRFVSFSFLQMVCHTLEMRPLLKVRQKELEEIEGELVKYDNLLLDLEPNVFDQEYDSFLCSVKTALMLNDWTDEKEDEYLLERYNVRPGELRVKLELADWLLYATEELTRMLQFPAVIKEIKKLRMQLKYGVNEELLALLKLKGIGRIRARTLFKNGVKDIGDVKKADVISLVQLLGKKTALDIKEQVGQSFKDLKVKENKRKGQISLLDY